MNQIIWFPNTGVWAQFAAKPYGETIESYAGRIILGDVTETATRTAERLRWSTIDDPTDWSASLSGDLDVHETEGAFVKIKKLLSSMVGYKYPTGIYSIEVTPEVIQPFRQYLLDSETGCVAGDTVDCGITPSGQVVQLFLGDGPNGLNVYQFNGTVAIPVGNTIADEIRRTINQETKQYSFARVDPMTKMYCLFIPETDEEFYPDQCWAYHLPTGTWR